jgi:hypothetical protein
MGNGIEQLLQKLQNPDYRAELEQLPSAEDRRRRIAEDEDIGPVRRKDVEELQKEAARRYLQAPNQSFAAIDDNSILTTALACYWNDAAYWNPSYWADAYWALAGSRVPSSDASGDPS